MELIPLDNDSRVSLLLDLQECRFIQTILQALRMPVATTLRSFLFDLYDRFDHSSVLSFSNCFKVYDVLGTSYEPAVVSKCSLVEVHNVAGSRMFELELSRDQALLLCTLLGKCGSFYACPLETIHRRIWNPLSAWLHYPEEPEHAALVKEVWASANGDGFPTYAFKADYKPEESL